MSNRSGLRRGESLIYEEQEVGFGLTSRAVQLLLGKNYEDLEGFWTKQFALTRQNLDAVHSAFRPELLGEFCGLTELGDVLLTRHADMAAEVGTLAPRNCDEKQLFLFMRFYDVLLEACALLLSSTSRSGCVIRKAAGLAP